MPSALLEQRVASLERKMSELQELLSNGAKSKDWRRTMGMFGGDEVMKRIFERALDLRKADRLRARRRQR